MKTFEYLRPDRVGDAILVVRERACAAYIAGGTTLVDLMKLGVETPAVLADINGLPLSEIQVLPDGTLRIGALVRNSDLAWHPEVRGRFPVLSEAILSGASPQIRNMATLGGNLMQRTRCTYFRDGISPCNKRFPGSGCAALDGYNRSHAVLGTSESCIAAHPSDLCVAMALLDATVCVQGLESERRVPFAGLHLPPGDTPERETTLARGELITAVEISPLPAGTRARYVKARDRASYEFALASAAAAVVVEGGVIGFARLALGGVATRPWRAFEAERLLVGEKPTPRVFMACAEAALAGAKPRKHNAFKVELARRVIARALALACGVEGS